MISRFALALMLLSGPALAWGLVRALGALPIALEQRIVGFQKPATGESRLR